MEARTHLGGNRTGMQTSPLASARMLEGDSEFPVLESDERQDAEVRFDYANEADALGSVPVPTKVSGVLKSGLEMLKGQRPQVLIDKLGERLAFERGGVRLYDTLLVKARLASELLGEDGLARLQHFRDEEAQHMDLVKQALERLGADPTAQTPCADLVGVESMGLMQAMNDPRTNLLQSLHVMLDAELLDNAAWHMLVELCRECGHEELAEKFTIAHLQEQEHLTHLRTLVMQMTAKEAKLMGTPAADMDGAVA